MSFKDRSWKARFDAMGDEAEGVFEATYPQGFVKFGLSRPPVNLARVPPFVRYTPDYLTAKGLVEVQGFGRDQTFKLKDDKLVALKEWNAATAWRVDVFVWDSKNKRYGWIRLPELIGQVQAGGAKLEIFPEGKAYWAIPAAELRVAEWTEFTPT